MSYLTDSAARQQISEVLKSFLADTAVLYMKTHGFHWNVEGVHFHSLHLLFEDQYTDLWKSLDVIAERIRALGFKAPYSLQGLQGLSEMKEATQIPNERGMLEELRDCNMLLSHKASECASLAEKFDDRVTADMMTQRAEKLEMNAWMLNSSIGES